MKRVMIALGAVALLVLTVWIARNTEWVDTKVPRPPRGEALTNPFYAAQKFVQTLGGSTAWDRTWSTPSTNAVIVLSAWHWDLSDRRREGLERWVENGGRLVVDLSLTGGLESFERWSGITREVNLKRLKEDADDEPEPDPCKRFTEEHNGAATAAETHWLCDFGTYSFLKARTPPQWAISGPDGPQAMRVGVGRGSVTVLNGAPFRSRSLLDGDHGWLLVASTQFHAGDDVRFLSEDDHPSLLALMWQHGSPAVTLMLAIVALALWRGWVRFGPQAVPPPKARRSLAEQIRGSGQFALRHSGGDSLHGAVLRALTEAVTRRVPGYKGLPPQAQTAALSQLTGIDRETLAAAIHHAASRRAQGLRTTLALLETARRRALTQQVRSSDGTH
jgi:hypothetical protein